jgi:branched-chain amino acid transport system permease protein
MWAMAVTFASGLRVRRRAIKGIALATAALGLLAACTDTETVRADICTTVISGIHVGADELDILTTVPDDSSNTVRLTYRLRVEGRSTRVRWVECLFEGPNFPEMVPDLVAVNTSNGPLGDGRLFVLKRWWLLEDPASWQVDES